MAPERIVPRGKSPLAFLAGLVAAALAAAVVGVTAAHAQSQAPTVIQPPPAPRAVAPARRATPSPPDPANGEEDPFPALSRLLRPTTRDQPAAEDEEEGEPATLADPAQPDRLRTDLQRRAPRDGDLAMPAEPEDVVDGVIATGEPAAPVDGADGAEVDSRSPADIAAFDGEPAGFNPDLFQVEIAPILDRRPAQLFRFEPYQPIGIKVGSFVLLPEAELALAWQSNVLRTVRKKRADTLFDVRPSARLVSNWRAHALEFRVRGGLSFFNELSSEDERTYTLEARGRLDITRRTSLEGLISRDVGQESRGSIDSRAGGRSRIAITTDRAAVTLNHRFNRLSVQLRGAVSEQDYGSARDELTGVLVRNDDRDRRRTEEALRLTWEFKPTLLAFTEVALDQRQFRAAPASDGVKRDATGERYRVGIGFGNADQRLRGEIAVGYGIHRPEAAHLAPVEAVLIDANLAYRVSPLTAFLVTASTDFADTTQAGSAAAVSYQIGTETRHAFLRHLIGTSGTSITWRDFGGIDLVEREVRSTVGLEYYIGREAVLFGRYQHVAFSSTQPKSAYGADEVRVGVRVRR
jgi:hypothetical protein